MHCQSEHPQFMIGGGREGVFGLGSKKETFVDGCSNIRHGDTTEQPGGDLCGQAVDTQHAVLQYGRAGAAGEASHNDSGVQKRSSFRYRAILNQLQLIS